jgi:hypothetical protein
MRQPAHFVNAAKAASLLSAFPRRQEASEALDPRLRGDDERVWFDIPAKAGIQAFPA